VPLDAINSGQAPRVRPSLNGGIPQVISNISAPVSDARSTQNHYTVQNNISTTNADSFRKSSGQIMGDAGVHMQRMGIRNG
jgi:hypothetical protein